MNDILKILICVFALPAFFAGPLAWSRDQPTYIEELLRGDDAIVVTGLDKSRSPVVTLGRRFGGAVVSVYFRNVDYVNNHNGRNEVDYGRQLQSAVTYRDVGECFNPTEAGGRYDRGKAVSSSRLQFVERPESYMAVTQTEMAFWMAPNEEKAKSGKECTALNTSVRGGYFLKRSLEVGIEGFPNVIRYKTQFIAPIIEPTPRYVPVVIHAPIRFSRVYRVHPDGTAEEVVNRRAQRGDAPYMISTDDQQHAMVVCSATPQGNTFYGYTRWPNTMVSRFVYFAPGPEKESRVFENYVIVGTTSEVRMAVPRFCMPR